MNLDTKMQFKTFLETAEQIFKLAYSLGEMPRKEVENLINKRDWNREWLDRNAFTTYFGWSLPCKEAVETIKKYTREPLHDVLAGTGYWAKILKKAGINVIASDIHKLTSKNWYHKKKENTLLTDISNIIKPKKEKIIRRNALKVGYDIKRKRLQGDIFLSWPPYEKSFVTDLIYMLPIGTRVFYIGEGMGGCTGDASFHKYLCDNFKRLDYEELPQWRGMHDYLTVYEKEKNGNINNKIRGNYWVDGE